MLVSAFAVAMLISAQIEPLVVLILMVTIVIGGTLARTGWRKVLGLAAKFEFVILFWVLLEPFIYGSTVILTIQLPWGPVYAYAEGLAFGILLGLRMFAIMLVFLATLSHMTLADFIGALRTLRFPSVLLGSLLIMLRYIPLFIEERTRMREAQVLRGFDKGTRSDRLRSLGYLIGSTIDRAFDRSVTVYESMTLRGFGKGMIVGGAGLKRADAALPVLLVMVFVSTLFLIPPLLELILA